MGSVMPLSALTGRRGGKRPTGAERTQTFRATAALALCALAGVLTLIASPAPAAARVRTGTLAVKVSGLPSWQRPLGLLRGPGTSRRITARLLTIRRARPGLYTLTLQRVKLTRGAGAVKRGALAYPTRSVRVRVRAGETARLAGGYTTIVNPGVVGLTGRVLSVGGEPANPSSVVLAGRHALHGSAILSMAPSAALPRGLLAHVRAARYARGRTTVALSPASVYEVMPVAQFDIPLHQSPTAVASAVKLKCGDDGALYRRIENVGFAGGWNTTNVFGVNVKVGVRVMVHFDAEAGLDTSAVAIGPGGLSCQVTVSANGMAGPIPVTAGIYGKLTLFAGAGASLHAGGSLHVQAGAATVGAPPLLFWAPQVQFSNPRFDFGVGAFA
jgi:hypothetical protein